MNDTSIQICKVLPLCTNKYQKVIAKNNCGVFRKNVLEIIILNKSRHFRVEILRKKKYMYESKVINISI